jgi:serine/threonine-protein kinase
MSPEQIMSKGLDARSDVYSSGVVLWEMLTSRKLFRQQSELEILKAITEKDTPPPSSVVSSLPDELDKITLKALKRSRELRFQTAGEMRMELSFMLRRKAEQSDTVAIGEYMQAMFFDRMQEKRRLIKSAQSAGANLEEALFGDLRYVKDDTEPSISPDTPPFAHTPTEPNDPDQQATVASGKPATPSGRNLVAAFVILGLLGILAIVFLVLPVGRKLIGLDQEPEKPRKTATPAVVEPVKTGPADAGTTMVVEPVVPETPKIKRPPKRKRQKVRKPRTPPTKALDLEPGRLRLATNPWTTVYFEGRKLGVTPLVDVKLPAGKHVLRAKNPGKGIDGKITVEIRPGETTSKSVSF